MTPNHVVACIQVVPRGDHVRLLLKITKLAWVATGRIKGHRRFDPHSSNCQTESYLPDLPGRVPPSNDLSRIVFISTCMYLLTI